MLSRAANGLASLVLALIALTSIGPGSAWAQAQCTAGQYTYNYTNYCSYPVWIAQTAAASNNQSYPPQGGNWAVAGSCTSNNQCSTGTCDLSTSQCTCNTASDCSGGATCGPSGTCSTTATFCMPQAWSSGTFWPRTGCTAVGGTGLNCLTGQCTATGAQNGLLDCGVGTTSPTNPVAQFEVTSTGGFANYDVSLVAGGNVEMKVVPVGGYYPEPGVAAPQNQVACYTSRCTAALNATCPANLQVTSAGAVIGCLDPCTQCQRTAPNGSTPNPAIYAALMCSSTITTDVSGNSPATTVTCGNTGGGPPTYQAMYCAANFGDTGSPPQASSNQGTDTAFAQSDCFPGKTYVLPTFASTYKGPAGAGVCLYASPPQNGISGFNNYGWADYASGQTLSCGNLPDGTACGGYLTGQTDTLNGGGTGTATYPNGLGYTCQTATYVDTTMQTQTAHLCMPPTVSGLGTCTYDSLGMKPLYTGVGGVYNASWLTAGLQAGGGSTPYYQTFKAACGASYTWQYDDASSGFACQAAAPPNGQVFNGFNVTFCGSQALLAASVAQPSVIAFTGSGDAQNVGTAGNQGTIVISGAFSLSGDVRLDQASIRLTDLLHEVDGAGELAHGPRGERVLPITLGARADSKPDDAVFRTPLDARTDVKVEIKKRALSENALTFAIAVDHATISQAARCAAQHHVATIETGFDLVIGARDVRIEATIPWRCDGRALLTP